MTDEEKIIRGNRARELLNDEVMTGAYAMVEAQAIEELLAADPLNDALRCVMVERINALRNVKQALVSVVTTGRAAALRNSGA